MSAFVVAPEAEDDLIRIWRYLLEHAGIAIADRIEGELLNAFESLAAAPGKGHRRADLTNQDVYFYTLYEYMIVYRRAARVEFVAVLHGRRNVERILKRRLAESR